MRNKRGLDERERAERFFRQLFFICVFTYIFTLPLHQEIGTLLIASGLLCIPVLLKMRQDLRWMREDALEDDLEDD